MTSTPSSSDAVQGQSAINSEPPPERASLGRTYWLCNIIEMWERLAYFVLRPIAPIYICQASEPGGLHLPQETKGWIYAWWALFQSFLPFVTGGLADRYGYKKTIFFSVTVNIIGYLLMAFTHSYYGFFAGIITLAIGTAFFKPGLQGTIAHQLSKGNSSIGWGIFYWVVNVGSVIGHYVSPLLLGQPHSADGWRTVFIFCACCTAMNYVMLFTFKDVPSGASKTESPFQVLIRTVVNIFDARLITWLLIMSCFWLMMYQLWDLQPNFIEDWVDSSSVAAHVPFDSWQEMGDRGLIRVPQQVLISLNSLLIVCCMVPVSWMVRKLRTLSAMFLGMVVATTGVLVAGLTGNGWVLLLGIVFFSLGEMLTGPKKNEYLGLIAPPGKKGLYLGYVNIPVGIGVFVGSYMAGLVYGHYGEKATLALKEMAADTATLANAAQRSDWSDSLERIPPLLNIERAGAFELARSHMGTHSDAAVERLKKLFRNDRGQIANLALLYLADREENRSKVAQALSKKWIASENADLKKRGERLAQDPSELKNMDLPGLVHLLPAAVGQTHTAAFDRVVSIINENRAPDEMMSDSEIKDMLWQNYGNSLGMINNLALEYVAQSTDLVRDGLLKIKFEHPADEVRGRVDEIRDRIGIGRTKAFAALSAALGADDDEVNATLDSIPVATANPEDRAYVYLIHCEYHRFVAIARQDWSRDLGFLRELVSSDDEAIEVVKVDIDDDTVTERIMMAMKSIFTGPPPADTGNPEGIPYWKLATKQDLIQKALAKKDWSKHPEQAARLLELNPTEARARVAAEIDNAALTATHALWNKYNPQYYVWLPFAAIGFVAAIALAIFGQMAKRWKDMNA